MIRRFALAVSLSLVAALALSSSAGATYHQNLIREVHEGGAGAGTGDYVMLQAFAAGENLVAGKHVVTYDGGGGKFSDFTFPGNVGNAANQATILVANDASVPGADFIAPGGLNVINTGGTVCYTESDGVTGIDCVAYIGSNAGTMFPSVPPASPYGPALSLGGQNLDGKSIVRSITRGCAGALDAADDTNNSAADFALGTPLKRNNAAPITETPCPQVQIPPGGASTCAGRPVTISGTNAADKLSGTPAVDVIAGQGGKDKIKGLAGADVICGGAGKDTLVGGKGKDLLRGEAGRDTLRGGPGKDKLKGGPGKDVQVQ